MALDQPLLIKLGDNQSTVRVFEALIIDITICTSKGQRLVKNQRLLIWDIPGDEVILGSDVLQALGIDPYSALDQLTSNGVGNYNSKGIAGGFLSTSELDTIRCSIDQDVVPIYN